MEKLTSYTGGIIYIHIALTVVACLALIFTIISLFFGIKKNSAIIKSQKINYIISIIVIIVQSLLIGALVGRYFCMVEMLK